MWGSYLVRRLPDLRPRGGGRQVTMRRRHTVAGRVEAVPGPWKSEGRGQGPGTWRRCQVEALSSPARRRDKAGPSGCTVAAAVAYEIPFVKREAKGVGEQERIRWTCAGRGQVGRCIFSLIFLLLGKRLSRRFWGYRGRRTKTNARARKMVDGK